jgi:glycosyltransferase involved in cell wall biosynthesis
MRPAASDDDATARSLSSAPLVSILLPVFDADDTLDACLRSVARQTEPRFECVIVDDGSRDGSLGRARRFAARDARFQVIGTRHAGLVAALQRGLAHCRAPLVARMDADDAMHRERLALQRAALAADSNLAAVGCHVRLFPRRGLGAGMRAYEAWLASIDSPQRVRAEAFVECPVAHPTLMLRRDALRDFGYRETGWPEDYDLILRMLAGGRRIGVVPRRLLSWRQRPGRLSRTDERYSTARFTACKAEHLVRTFLSRSGAYVLWGYGATGRSLARALRAHGRHPVQIVELHPRRIGERIQGAPVIPHAALGGPPAPPIVVSVAGAGARALIRAQLRHKGFREGCDYVCAA